MVVLYHGIFQSIECILHSFQNGCAHCSWWSMVIQHAETLYGEQKEW